MPLIDSDAFSLHEAGVRRRNEVEWSVCCNDYISQTHIIPTKDMQSFTGTTKRTRRSRARYYLPDSLHGDPEREPGVHCVEVPIHPTGHAQSAAYVGDADTRARTQVYTVQ